MMTWLTLFFWEGKDNYDLSCWSLWLKAYISDVTGTQNWLPIWIGRCSLFDLPNLGIQYCMFFQISMKLLQTHTAEHTQWTLRIFKNCDVLQSSVMHLQHDATHYPNNFWRNDASPNITTRNTQEINVFLRWETPICLDEQNSYKVGCQTIFCVPWLPWYYKDLQSLHIQNSCSKINLPRVHHQHLRSSKCLQPCTDSKW